MPHNNRKFGRRMNVVRDSIAQMHRQAMETANELLMNSADRSKPRCRSLRMLDAGYPEAIAGAFEIWVAFSPF